ncbi:Sporulation-specific protein 5 [Penicillium rolfsii]|nr:Sporulation-specific protein 5 [Penicillium rolfsii]
MRAQNNQATAASGAGQGNKGMTNSFHHEPRTPYASSYSPVYEDSAKMNQVSGVNFQQHHSNYAGRGRASVPVNMNTNLDWSATNGTPYANTNPFIVVPNPAFNNGLAHVSSFSPGSVPTPTNQNANVPRNVFGNLPTMMPTNPWPYMMGGDFVNRTLQQNPWMVPAWQKVATARAENNTPMQFQGPVTPSMANLSFPGGVMYPQFGPYALQMMKTATGYVVQDMEALTQQEPAIPRAVPAMWTNPSELTLAKCLENREGITNVYIRGFLPETNDEMLYAYAARFGKIERCKAIVDLETGLCKGFGFVQFQLFESCENCIRGFFFLGYQASFAQKSRNSRLKDLEDKSSTNIYCTNIPINWTEADLRRHFEPYRVVSEKISRDEETGVSKEVGFARFETREIAERVLAEFHNVTVEHDNVKLLLRFADTKAQKLLKQQSNERRAYRAGEYNYSVEVVQGSTPSPSLRSLRDRFQLTCDHITPKSQQSVNISPGEVGSTNSNWTPATSISPTYALMKKPGKGLPFKSRPRSLKELENTPMYRNGFIHRRSMTEITSSSKTARPESDNFETRSCMSFDVRSSGSSPKKGNSSSGSMSPIPSRAKLTVPTPRT